MDCTDIVIGMARGQQSRVYDYYTRDRATPRMDSFYGGEDSLTAAVAKEEDGVTSIKWRKRLQTGECVEGGAGECECVTWKLVSICVWCVGGKGGRS